VIATLLILAPLISLMPQATLGAVVVVSASGLIKPKDFRAIGQIRRVEVSWAAAALVGVVMLGTLRGILVAAVLSLLSLIYDANRPRVYALGRKRGSDVFRPLPEHPNDETFPGLLVVRTEGRMYFANAERVGEHLWPLIEASRPRVVLLDCSAIPDIEYTALVMLSEFEARLREGGISLWLAALNPEALRVTERSPLGAVLGHERMFFTVEQAVAAYLASGAHEPGVRARRPG
jgi:MFS superfamily sulfate permease-like transporter